MPDVNDQKQAEETLTPSEEAVQDETGATPAEAHRIGEFDDLVQRIGAMESSIAHVSEMVQGMREQMGTYRSVAIDNGAEVRDRPPSETDEVISQDAVQVIPDFSEFDLSM